MRDSDPHFIERLLEIMRRLRDPEHGCPWDRQQSYDSLVPFTVEEAYEVADAIARQDFHELRVELGDLLFQVVFYARIAEEEARFAFDDVVEAICDKLVRRHPHVFGGHQVADAATQTRDWEGHKERERSATAAHGSAGTLEGVARALPALIRAQKLQRRAARVGFDWSDAAAALAKIREESDELRAEMVSGEDSARAQEELGDLLFACVNVARHLDVDAESALRSANEKFERRFRAVESRLAESGKTPREASLEEMDGLWEEAKAAEKGQEASQNSKGKSEN